MPELPEVRAHAERLTHSHRGAVLDRFEALSFSVLKTVQPPPSDAAGEALRGVGTRGKYLLVEFNSTVFVVHLMQGGRLKPDAALSRKPRGGLARWRFSEHDALLLTEAGHERKAGVWVLPSDAVADAEVFGLLGPDADNVEVAELRTICDDAGNVRLHGFLRDQKRLAGIGRRLANEICWYMAVSPFTSTAKLTDDQIGELHQAMNACIGSALIDERSRDHIAPSAKRISQVHNRTGEPCPRCGDSVRAVEYKAYSVNYCATCQTNGKVLADNTTSKFLK